MASHPREEGRMGSGSAVPWDPHLHPPLWQLWGRSRYPRGAFLGDNLGHYKTFSTLLLLHTPGLNRSPFDPHPISPDTLSPEQGMLPGLPLSETQDIPGVISGTATLAWQDGGKNFFPCPPPCTGQPPAPRGGPPSPPGLRSPLPAPKAQAVPPPEGTQGDTVTGTGPSLSPRGARGTLGTAGAPNPPVSFLTF